MTGGLIIIIGFGGIMGGMPGMGGIPGMGGMPGSGGIPGIGGMPGSGGIPGTMPGIGGGNLGNPGLPVLNAAAMYNFKQIDKTESASSLALSYEKSVFYLFDRSDAVLGLPSTFDNSRGHFPYVFCPGYGFFSQTALQSTVHE